MIFNRSFCKSFFNSNGEYKTIVVAINKSVLGNEYDIKFVYKSDESHVVQYVWIRLNVIYNSKEKKDTNFYSRTIRNNFKI